MRDETTLSDLMLGAPQFVRAALPEAWVYQRIREGAAEDAFEFDRVWAPYYDGSRIAVHRITAPRSPRTARPFWHPHATALGVLVLPDMQGFGRTAYRLNLGVGPASDRSDIDEETRAGRGEIRRVASIEWQTAGDDKYSNTAQLYLMEPETWHDILVTEGSVTTICVFAPEGMPAGDARIDEVTAMARNPLVWDSARNLLMTVKGREAGRI